MSYKANAGGGAEGVASSDDNRETESRETEGEADDEESPLISRDTMFEKPKSWHPFIKLLGALWPFGESFKELGIGGKIYESLKVRDLILWTGNL